MSERPPARAQLHHFSSHPLSPRGLTASRQRQTDQLILSDSFSILFQFFFASLSPLSDNAMPLVTLHLVFISFFVLQFKLQSRNFRHLSPPQNKLLLQPARQLLPQNMSECYENQYIMIVL
jgi:hypothetical protein